MPYYDQHIHSFFSQDSQEDLENYYKIACEKKVNYLVTCEHFDPHTVVDKFTWKADYDKLIRLQELYKQKYPFITPLLGIEVGFRQDCLDEINDYVSKYKFDLIQLSLHDDGKVDFYFKDAFINNPEDKLEYYFELLYKGINTYKNYDVLSHIDYGFKTAREVNKDLKISKYEAIITKILKTIIKERKALEVNTKVQEKINDDENIIFILNLYKKLGGKRVTLSSDAHSTDRYMSSFNKYMQIIKDCGFNELCYYIQRKEYRYKI